MAFGQGNIAKISAIANYKTLEGRGGNVQLLVFKEKDWEKVLNTEDSNGHFDMTCNQMSKMARYKDYLYLSDDEIPPVAFDRQIDFEN